MGASSGFLAKPSFSSTVKMVLQISDDVGCREKEGRERDIQASISAGVKMCETGSPEIGSRVRVANSTV